MQKEISLHSINHRIRILKRSDRYIEYQNQPYNPKTLKNQAEMITEYKTYWIFADEPTGFWIIMSALVVIKINRDYSQAVAK